MKTYREFCIDLKDMFSVEASGVPLGMNGIHVIEHSAYDALAKENEELRAEIEKFKSGVNNFKCVHCGDYTSPFAPVNLLSEITSLRESLKLAVEALTNYACDPCNGTVERPCFRYKACEALDKIKAKHGEL